MRRVFRVLLQPLVALALVFVVSAALRLTDGIGPVFATTGAQDIGSETDAGGLVCNGLPELELMYRTLQSERIELDERLAAVALREDQVDQVEGLVWESYEELQLMQSELTAERAAFEQEKQDVVDAAESDLDRLVSVYEAMKPKEAAGLFETMSPEFAAGFLGRMQPEAAAQILSGVSSDFAYAVSVLIAGKNIPAAQRVEQMQNSFTQ